MKALALAATIGALFLFTSIGALGSVASSQTEPVGGSCAPGALPDGAFSQADIAKLWEAVGGPTTDVNGDGVPEDDTAGAVGMAESGGDPLIEGIVIPATGQRASGLMQIHPPEPGWQNPEKNMRMGLRKFRAAGRTWQPWEAYTGPDGSGSDGPWRQYLGRGAETSAITCALGGNVKVGAANAGEAADAIGIGLNSSQRQDLLSGGIDPKVLAVLAWIGKDHTITVTALRRDHSPGSNHEAGRAIDIGIVDGKVCRPYGPRDPCGKLLIALTELDELRPTELIGCFDPDGDDPRSWAQGDHCNHLHVGWDS